MSNSWGRKWRLRPAPSVFDIIWQVLIFLLLIIMAKFKNIRKSAPISSHLAVGDRATGPNEATANNRLAVKKSNQMVRFVFILSVLVSLQLVLLLSILFLNQNLIK